MANTRERYSADFKAKVASEALKGDLTLTQLAAKHGVHQTMISTWRKQTVDGMSSVFSGQAEAAEASREADVEKLRINHDLFSLAVTATTPPIMIAAMPKRA